MSARKRFKKAAEKRDGGRFVAVPVQVLESTAYVSLSAHARALLWDLAAQYTGDNNGDFCASWSVMQKRGWRSPDTLNRAKRQLLESLLAVETRKGSRPNKASLYGLTWWALDDCGGKLDITAAGFPRGAYKQRGPLPFLKNRPPLVVLENDK